MTKNDHFETQKCHFWTFLASFKISFSSLQHPSHVAKKGPVDLTPTVKEFLRFSHAAELRACGCKSIFLISNVNTKGTKLTTVHATITVQPNCYKTVDNIGDLEFRNSFRDIMRHGWPSIFTIRRTWHGSDNRHLGSPDRLINICFKILKNIILSHVICKPKCN